MSGHSAVGFRKLQKSHSIFETFCTDKVLYNKNCHHVMVILLKVVTMKTVIEKVSKILFELVHLPLI
jgi:hypothetical protein